MAGFYDSPNQPAFNDSAYLDPSMLGSSIRTYDDLNRLHDQYGTDVRQNIATWNKNAGGFAAQGRTFGKLTPDQQATVLRGGSLGWFDFNQDTVARTGLSREQLAAYDQRNPYTGAQMSADNLGSSAAQNIAQWNQTQPSRLFSSLPKEMQDQIAIMGYGEQPELLRQQGGLGGGGSEGDKPPAGTPPAGTPQPKPPASMTGLLGGGAPTPTGGGAAGPAMSNGGATLREGVGGRQKPSLQAFFGNQRAY